MHESIRYVNARRCTADYSNRLPRLQSRPRAVFVELTQRCNLACSMCRSTSSPYQSHIMSNSIFDKVAEELFPYAETIDLRGWGESLLLSDFPQRVASVMKAGCQLRIMSNLSFERNDSLKALARANATVGISLDAAAQSVLSKVRAGANLNRIRHNIQNLARYYDDYGSDFRKVYISVTLVPDNIDQVPKIVEFASQHRIHQVRLFPGMLDNNYLLREPEDILRSQASLCCAFDIANQSAVDLWVGARLWPGMDCHVASYDSPCIHPWAYCFISWKGEVGFCDYLMGPGCEVHFVGNLAEETFESIWNGSKMQDIRSLHVHRTMKTNDATWRCEWCYNNRFVDFEDEYTKSYSARKVRAGNWCKSNQV
jgi:MoaA/NifB/PqqE/SkfB family radical SAM enzyme